MVHRNIEELLASTKRIQATLTNGHAPTNLSADVVWQQIDGRRWVLTIADFRPETVQEISSLEGVDNVEVIDVGLEELFKDFVKGQRSAP